MVSIKKQVKFDGPLLSGAGAFLNSEGLYDSHEVPNLPMKHPLAARMAFRSCVLVILAVLLGLVSDCRAAEKQEQQAASAGSGEAPVDNAGSFGELDIHFVPAGAFFVGDTALDGRDWIYVYPAMKESLPLPGKMLKESFFLLKNGKHVWPGYSFKSRVASRDDLRPGALVLYAEKWGGGHYVPPASYEQASNSLWVIAKITDMSAVNDGYLTVSGPSRVSLDSLRVIVK